MYKDKDRQREANRQAKARQRVKSMTKGMTLSAEVIPNHPGFVIPKRGKDRIYEHRMKKMQARHQRSTNEIIREGLMATAKDRCIGTIPVTPPIIDVIPERTIKGNLR